MRMEERLAVQGPVKKQQPDGMSHSARAQQTGPCRTERPTCVARIQGNFFFGAVWTVRRCGVSWVHEEVQVVVAVVGVA